MKVLDMHLANGSSVHVSPLKPMENEWMSPSYTFRSAARFEPESYPPLNKMPTEALSLILRRMASVCSFPYSSESSSRLAELVAGMICDVSNKFWRVI